MKNLKFFGDLIKMIVACFLLPCLVACGGDNKKSSTTINNVPTISGVPANTVALGKNYDFTPIAADADADVLSYSISNKPVWANFDPVSGRLFGLADVEGVYGNIVISVSDATGKTALSAFNITVTSQAGLGDIAVVSELQGSTPFINFLTLQGQLLDKVKHVEYVIQPKPNSVSKSVHVKYSRAALQNRGYISNADSLIIPVYGLYAGYENHLLLHVGFEDTSSKTLSYIINSPQYLDPNKTYDQPVILKKRKLNTALGFDFFAIKSLVGAPVIIDTDGELRWAAALPEVASGAAAIFHNNAFVIGDQVSTKFFSFELDGKVTEGAVPVISYTNFHHNIDAGKSGYLGEFDAEVDGVKNIESIIAEFDLSGAVAREWDFSKIIFDYMKSAGDDPSSFIRPGIDWFHSNAATYDSRDDSLIVSSRENFVIKVDYETKEIVWVLGDPTKYWNYFPSLNAKAVVLDSGIYPIGQHAVSVTSDGLLLLFNNGAASFNQPQWAPVGESRNYSAISAYDINPITLSGREVWRFNYNESILSDICSSVYEGDEKSLLISYATASNRTKARLVGLDKEHDVVFDFEYPSTKICASWNAVPIGLDKMNII